MRENKFPRVHLNEVANSFDVILSLFAIFVYSSNYDAYMILL